MSEANIAICRRWFAEAWNQRRDDVRGTTWMRLDKGKLIEGWDNWNFAGLMQQLR